MGILTFKLQDFEGPLDLLLYLITKHKLDIYNIQISALLEQYLDYVEGISEYDFEYAGEFLEMAARLILIKTLSLLPKHEEADEMKRELQGRLIEYSLCKQAAQKLTQAYVGDKIFVRKPTELQAIKTYTQTHNPEDLINAYFGISDKKLKDNPIEASVFKPIVSKKIVSVTSKVVFLLRRLYKTGKCNMNEIFEGMTEKSEKIATFLAILELTKTGRIFLNDDNTEINFERSKKNAT